ncbi:hypothetical protein B0J14DRAFT_567319 [Halenospora varia]|nr:hypothetical protein B0J14DRAFT_567319 [Halenospora varia]
MNFGSDHGYNRRLEGAGIKPRIEATLLHLKLLFANTDELAKQYGIRIEEKEVNGVVRSYGAVQIWKSSFDRYRDILRRTQKKASVMKVTRWSIRDAKKFETLVDRASELMRDLNDMTKDFVSQQRHEEIANEEAETIEDIAKLQRVQAAIAPGAGYAETIISTTASAWQQRLERLVAGTINTEMDSLRSREDDTNSNAGAS